MPGYGARYWEERTADNRRRTYPKFKGSETADAVIIGGGLTGATAAFVLASGGLKVVVLEAGRLAGGATAGGLGTILPEPDASFRDVEAAAGRRPARVAWEEAHRSAREFAAALEKLPTKSDLKPAALVLNARTVDDGAFARKEQAARREASIVAPWMTPAAARAGIATDSVGGIRLTDASVYDPVRATLGLAGAAAAKGARIFEQSPARRTRFTRKYADVILATGAIRTTLVFVASGEPGTLFSQLRRHVRRETGYVVVTQPLTGPMRRAAGKRDSVQTEIGGSPGDRPWLRWLADDRVLFAGARGAMPPARQREKLLVPRTAQLMYELSLRYPEFSGLPAHWGWEQPVVTTPDGLPWIGGHRNFPFHFFALALGWHGDALAWLAAKAALRQARGEARPTDATLGFARYL